MAFLRRLLAGRPDRAFAPQARPAGPRRWLPVIDTESCTGCGLCLLACDHGCLGMVWEFATLVHPEACRGEGRCAEVCREGVIQMDWVEAAGDPEQGRREGGGR